MLQGAALAEVNGASDERITAKLLYDIRLLAIEFGAYLFSRHVR